MKLLHDHGTCSSNLQLPQPSFEVLLANYLVLILIKYNLQLEMWCYQWNSAVEIQSKIFNRIKMFPFIIFYNINTSVKLIFACWKSFFQSIAHLKERAVLYVFLSLCH